MGLNKHDIQQENANQAADQCNQTDGGDADVGGQVITLCDGHGRK